MPTSYKIGDKYGELTIIDKSVESLSTGRKISYAICKCDCGKLSKTTITKLRNGRVKTCGDRKIHGFKHHMAKTTEYRIWSGMKNRCLNESDKRYSSYGGRGITVDKKWLDFKGFYEDMGRRPIGTTLDRIDNNKGYSKDNCRWATAEQQMNNTRKSVFIEYNGVKKTRMQWSRKLGISYGCLRKRLSKGWILDIALTSQRYKKGCAK